MMDTTPEHDDDPAEYPDDDGCLEEGNPDDPCRGPVEYHNTGGTRSFPRCQHHAEERLEREMENRRRHPMLQPADWSPDDAGEHWANDY